MHGNFSLRERVLHLATIQLAHHLRRWLTACKQQHFYNLKHLQNSILLKLITQHQQPPLTQLIKIIYNYNKKILLQYQLNLQTQEQQFLARSSAKSYLIMIIKRQIEIQMTRRQQQKIKIEYDIISNYLNLNEGNQCKEEGSQPICSYKEKVPTELTNIHSQYQDRDYIKLQQKEECLALYKEAEEQAQNVHSPSDSNRINKINLEESKCINHRQSLINNENPKYHEAKQISIETRHFDKQKEDSCLDIQCKEEQYEHQNKAILDQTQTNGHFAFGDQIQQIKSFYLLQNVMFGLIIWKQRQQGGHKPVDSHLSVQEIRNYAPHKLCDSLKMHIIRMKNDV